MGAGKSFAVTIPQQRRGATVWNCQGLPRRVQNNEALDPSEFLSCDHKRRVPQTCGHNRENNENQTVCARTGWYSLDATPPERLKLAITKLCGTRLVHTGKVTALLREKCAGDTARADARRKAHTQADLEKKVRAHLRKGVTFNQVNRTPTHSSSHASTNPIIPFVY